MKRLLLLLALLYANLGHAQETTIRILGVYPSQLSMVQADMTAQLQAIATAWNDSGLPGESVTTVQLLNSATAVPVSYPNLPGSNWDTAISEMHFITGPPSIRSIALLCDPLD